MRKTPRRRDNTGGTGRARAGGAHRAERLATRSIPQEGRRESASSWSRNRVVNFRAILATPQTRANSPTGVGSPMRWHNQSCSP
eukprot:994660-Pyramimonas_sp.AAC.1